MSFLNWLRKAWSLITVVILASLICGPAAGWITTHIGAGFAQAALVIDGLASICLVLLFIDFMLDTRKEWGIFPTLDLNGAAGYAVHGVGPGGYRSPIACAIVYAATIALIIAILFLAIPRAGELLAMPPQPVDRPTVSNQAG